jgi:hypothetical protein
MVDAMNGSAIAALAVAGAPAASATAKPTVEISGGLTQLAFPRGVAAGSLASSDQVAAPTRSRSRLAPQLLSVAMYQ